MLSLDFNRQDREDISILCLGAHSDDLEIGACATILGIGNRHAAARIMWVVFAGEGSRGVEARASAEHCTRAFNDAQIEIYGFRDSRFPRQVDEIKQRFEALKDSYRPDVVFTHFRHDLHQDHRIVSDLTWQTFRDHLILEYEIPKYEGDMRTPNFYYPVSIQQLETKLDVLDRYFVSQRDRTWFEADTFRSLMRLRGIECNSPSGFAEAFYCRKLVFAGPAPDEC